MKFEIRNSKFESNSNDKIRKGFPLVIPVSNLIRISNFEFRIYTGDSMQ
jgi:hypothetical protein